MGFGSSVQQLEQLFSNSGTPIFLGVRTAIFGMSIFSRSIFHRWHVAEQHGGIWHILMV
jgi:hypothetical protein